MAPFLLVVCLLASCNKSDDLSDPVSGVVVNAFTKAPVTNARLALLENGAVVFTDGNGAFRFSDEEISALPESDMVSLNGTNSVGLNVSHADYRPLETNAALGKKTTIEVVPSDIPAYVYHQPVQLNDGIRTGTLDAVQMDKQTIQNLMDRLYGDQYKEIHSLLVYRHDQLVLEEYFYGNHDTIQFENNIAVDRTPPHIQWSRNEKHYIASVNKSLTSTLVGIALNQYGLTPDSKIAPYLPEYASYFSDPKKAEITFSDCLTMTAGFQWDEWGANDLSLLWKSDDFADFVLSRNSLGTGAEWRYNSALPNLLLKTIDNLSGGDVRGWANDHFYHKLGITDLGWQSQPDGYPEGAARMFIRPRDMLKVGITYLNDGVWDGEQVIPSAWVDACMDVKENTSSGDYSYYFWLRNLDGVPYLSADGDGGNYINIIPSLDMVIVVTQGNYLLWPFYVNQVDDIMKNYIFTASE